jgi:hypothetical protein
MHRTSRTAASLIALLLSVAVAGSGCSSDAASSSATTKTTDATTTTEPTTTTEAPTLEERIAADFQGVQLDVVGDGPAPGGTSMFFQDGSWAAAAAWKSQDEWCLAGLFDWTVTDAKSPTDFTIQYERTKAFPECVDIPADQQFALHVTGTNEQGGRTVYDAKYAYPDAKGFAATRTVCSTTWDDPDRCGLDTPGLEVPAPPAP